MGDPATRLTAGSTCLLPVWHSFDGRYEAGSEFVYFPVELIDSLGQDAFRQCSRPVWLEAPRGARDCLPVLSGPGPLGAMPPGQRCHPDVSWVAPRTWGLRTETKADVEPEWR